MAPLRAARLLRRNAIFRRFLLASTISLLGSSIFDIAMPLYVLERTHSAFLLALVNVALYLPYVILAPLTGYSVDHFDKRRIMIGSDLAQVVALTFLLIYQMTSAANIWPVILTVFIAKSMMMLFETVSSFQLVPALVESEDLSFANTWFLSVQRTIQIVGPLAGGVLMGTLGIKSCIAVNLVSFGATLYFSFRLKNLNALIEREFGVPHSPKVSFQGMVHDFRDSIRFVWDTPLFRPFIFLMFFLNLSSLMPNAPTFTYYFREMESFSSAGYGLALSVFALMGVVGYFCSPWLYRQLPFHSVFAASGLLFAALATSAVLFVPSPLALVILYSLARASSSVLTMGTYLIRQTRIPKSRMGGANACIRMFFMAGAPVSALLQAYLIAHFGVGISFGMGAACLWAAYQSARLVSRAYEEASPAVAEGVRAA